MTGRHLPPVCVEGGLTALVLAKEPRPGHTKTRLVPHFGADGAASLAGAALRDTLDVVRRATVDRRVLVLDGSSNALPCGGFDVVPQVPGSHAERIIGAFETAAGAAVLVGMDTPQLRPGDLELDLAAPADAWLGPAEDGGWWVLGLRHARRDARMVLTGVPMSTPDTCRATHLALQDRGLRVASLRVLRDVDEADDAQAVAGTAPNTRFAVRWSELTASPGATPVPDAR